MSTPLTYRIVRAMRSSGRNGYPSVRYVFEIHARHQVGSPLAPVLRKDGRPREFQSRQAARVAIRRMRAGGAA